jgi:hypothetical protein
LQYALFFWDHGNSWRGFGDDALPGVMQSGVRYPKSLSLLQLTKAV